MSVEIQYEGLTRKLEECLPIKAYPIRELVQELRKNGIVLALKTELSIIKVLNSGDISGIMCEVDRSSDGNEVLLCGLSHLVFSSNHPLYKEIIEYQIKRAKRIKKLNR